MNGKTDDNNRYVAGALVNRKPLTIKSAANCIGDVAADRRCVPSYFFVFLPPYNPDDVVIFESFLEFE